MNNERKLADLPNDWWQKLSTCNTLADWFGRHIVGLLFYVQAEGSKPEVRVYTGFVLYYEENLLWITAGHVVDIIRDLLSNPKIKVKIMRWLDGCEIPGAEFIPVHNRNLYMFSSSEIGVDFGAIGITGLDAENMLNNNRTQVITELIWKNLHLAKPEGYYVLGYPQEWIKHEEEQLSDNRILNLFRVNLACLPVRRIEYRGDIHTKEFWNDPEAFYGQIIPFVDEPEYQPASVGGMSGGPLFSIERDPSDRIRYRLFGIQRSEDKDEKLIRVEPMHKILGRMQT